MFAGRDVFLAWLTLPTATLAPGVLLALIIDNSKVLKCRKPLFIFLSPPMPLLFALNLCKALTFPPPQMARCSLFHLKGELVPISSCTLAGWCLFVSQGLFLLDTVLCITTPLILRDFSLFPSLPIFTHAPPSALPKLDMGDHFIIMDLILDLG